MANELTKAQGRIRKGIEARVGGVVAELDNEDISQLEQKAASLLADLRALRMVTERLDAAAREAAVQQTLIDRGAGDRAQASLARLRDQETQLSKTLLTLANGLG